MDVSYKVLIQKGNKDYTASPKFIRKGEYWRTVNNNESDLTTIDSLKEQLSKLNIEATSIRNNANHETRDIEIPAGKINKIITHLGIALIEPLSTNDLLFFGTLLYVQSLYEKDINNKHYIPLGYIDDIFGSIAEPMYSVNFVQNLANLHIGDEVYYLPSHPCTQHMRVKRTVSY